MKEDVFGLEMFYVSLSSHHVLSNVVRFICRPRGGGLRRRRAGSWWAVPLL